MNKAHEFIKITDKMNEIFQAKNADYGDSFSKQFEEFGPTSVAVRLADKLNRYKQLTKEGYEVKVKEESIFDTLVDLANYAILAAIEHKAARNLYKPLIPQNNQTYQILQAIGNDVIMYGVGDRRYYVTTADYIEQSGLVIEEEASKIILQCGHSSDEDKYRL